MIRILSKDSIKKYIVPYLSVGKRGGSRHELADIVSAILYKLKTGVHWRYVPLKALIYRAKIKWGSLFYHFRKWSKDGSWQAAMSNLINQHKRLLNLQVGQLDGTHTTAKRGGEAVGYQGWKKQSTSNTLWLTDCKGLVAGFSQPIAGNHHDVYQIETSLDRLVEQMRKSGISVNGLFLNADKGFDSEEFRKACQKHQIMANVPENKRNTTSPSLQSYFFDEEMYRYRYTIERTNAWCDSYRTLLVRHDTSIDSWSAWHYLFVIIQWIKKIVKL